MEDKDEWILKRMVKLDSIVMEIVIVLNDGSNGHLTEKEALSKVRELIKKDEHNAKHLS